MNGIEQRLLKLENSLRLYRVFFSTAIIALIAVIFMSSGKINDVPDVIKAKNFQVVDNNGNILLELSQAKGNGQLITYSPTGQKLVRLFTSEGGAGAINTFDGNGKLNFKITKTTDGGGYMALYNSDEKEIIEAGSIIGNAGYLQVNDHSGTKIAWITEVKDGGGSLSLHNKDLGLIFLEAQEAGGRVSIYNKGDVRIGYIGAQNDQSGRAVVFDKSGTISGSLPN